MRRYLQNDNVLKDCKIYQMLLSNAGKHLSFHTPGHKNAAWDITELSFSDNLSCPRGCIAEAERDIAEIVGSAKSFILTDGSTSGVLSMLYAAKLLGAKTVAFSLQSHKSVFNACKVLQLTPLVYENQNDGGMYAFNDEERAIFHQADVLFFTSPSYYGNIAPLKEARSFCNKNGKLLLVDGAHGGHLHYHKEIYAGAYADMWVDGVHKSLPAFTQGAVVSARNAKIAEALGQAVDVFRTTSPSYPIMASVEYAVKYPQNVGLEQAVRAYAAEQSRIQLTQDWTKLCACFGERAFEVAKQLETEGIYPEFCDGNVIMFYLSPATKQEDFEILKNRLNALFIEYPLVERENIPIHTPLILRENAKIEWVALHKSMGRICAGLCGLFPPCTPLIRVGERISEDKVALLEKVDNVFGLKDEKIAVYEE